MKRNLIWTVALAVVLILTPPAAAQLQIVGPNTGEGADPRPTDTDDYIYDSGVSDNAVGLNNGNAVAWIHWFPTNGGGTDKITAISTVWGTPAFPGSSGIVAGQDCQVHCWSDPNGDGQPGDAVVINSANCTVDECIECDVFQKIPINCDVDGAFFVGVATQGFFQGAVDGSFNNNDAWVDFNDPVVYDPNGIAAALNLNAVVGGVWLLRANASGDVPAMSQWGMIALIGLVMVGSLFFMRRRATA